MGFRIWLACNATPLLLRLALAATFLWAGYGKLAYNDPVSGAEAAILANLGVIKLSTTAPAPPAPAENPAAPPDSPESSDEPGTPELPGHNLPSSDRPADPAAPQQDAMHRGQSPGGFTLFRARAMRSETIAPATMSPAPRQYTAEDFPTPVIVPRLYHIATGLYRAAHPEDPSKQLWPKQLADARTIIVLSWMAAITETAGGTLVLFGFLTRFAALGLAFTMFVAMLLTTIGPAAVSGSGFLGFLPPPQMNDPAAWGDAWTPMLFQFCLLMSSLGLFFTGAGGLSLDRLIFGGVGRGSPKPAASKTT